MKCRHRTIEQALILAAGNGRRLASPNGLPKPLTPIGHRAMIDHILGHLAQAGLKKVFVVVGYRAGEIEHHLRQTRFSNLIEIIYNPDYARPNGVSLLCAEDHIVENFLLLMSDHLFEAESLRSVLNEAPPEDGGLLVVDSKLDRIFDLADATKVQRWDGKLARLGKDLNFFDAVDTGMFALTPAVFASMRESIRAKEESLSGGIAELAQRSLVLTQDIGARRWIDVDTPEAAAEAERLWSSGLFQSGPAASSNTSGLAPMDPGPLEETVS